MNELPVSSVNANVGDLAIGDAKEQDIPSPKVRYRYALRVAKLVPGTSGNVYADFFVGVLHQATAVKAVRARTTVSVRYADQGLGHRDHLLSGYLPPMAQGCPVGGTDVGACRNE